MINVIVVDDHPVVRHGVALMLQANEDIDVVATLPDARRLSETVDESHPQVILMDLSMPGGDGAEATRRLLATHPDLAVVVLTSFSDQDRIQEALDAGAVGYMLKDCEPSELVEAVRAAARGESPLHPKAARIALQRRANPAVTTALPGGLTERERDVLRLVARGLTNGQIATRLGISERTVKGHLTNVFTRLGVADRTSAALWAQRNLEG